MLHQEKSSGRQRGIMSKPKTQAQRLMAWTEARHDFEDTMQAVEELLGKGSITQEVANR